MVGYTNQVAFYEERSPFMRLVPLLFGIGVVAALSLLLLQVVQASTERDKALTSQKHSFEVIARALAVDGTIAKAESTLARYVVSQDKQIGLIYQSRWSTAGNQIAELTRQVRGDREQERLVEALQNAYDDRGKLLNDIALRTSYKQESSLGRYYAAGKAPSLQHITDLLDAIVARENRRLNERSEVVSVSQDRSERLTRTWLAAGLVLLTGALGLAWWVSIALRESQRASDQAEEEAQRAYDLEQAVARRTRQLAEANSALRKEAAEREATEAHLRQLHKLEAVGQLTGGIAHDFNNMLAVVVGGLELAKRRLHEDPAEAEKQLDSALLGADRAAALTRQLLAFARAEPVLPAHVRADELIAGMNDLIDRTIGDQISVAIDPQSDDWGIYADRHQLENALLNLCVNARDAMEGRGTITIASHCVTLKQNEVGKCAPGDYVGLAVTDTGAGMTPDVIARVFEPFFTTKTVGKGTGLGLSQIYGFVHQSKGEIRIQSEVGKGTTVEMLLPRHVASGAARKEAPRPAIITADQGVRVLVVEDDPRVLSSTMAAVRELGHVPVACDHPSKAAGILGEDGGDIQLILSDVLMPDITGPEMVRALPDRFHAIPVLFLTGYAAEVQDAAMFAGHSVLRKPYTLAGLSTSIAKALSERPQTAADAEAA